VRFLANDTVTPGDLAQFPGNPNRGAVTRIMESLARFGQYKALTVREAHDDQPRTILAGNHTAQAFERLQAMSDAELADKYGEHAHRPPAELRIELYECDDDEARRIVAGDNQLADLAETDDRALAEILLGMDGDFLGSGFDDATVNAILTESDALGDAASKFLDGQDPGEELDDEETAFPARPGGGEFVLVSWMVRPEDREQIRAAIAAAQAQLEAQGRPDATAAVAITHVAKAYLQQQEKETATA
jgi:hypothetical protein